MEIDIIEPDCYYHIYNRGNNRQPIFLQHDHYLKFFVLCAKYLPGHLDILSYCLIPNHFHFLMYVYPDIDWHTKCSGCTPLNKLFNSYAQWFNKRTNRTGKLFEGPFKRKRIQDQDYLKHVIYYIHRNPMHHNITSQPDEYAYSSFKSISDDQPSLINRNHLFEWFDGPKHFAEFHKQQFEFEAKEFFDDY